MMRKKIFALAVAATAVLGAQAQNMIDGHEYADLGLPSGTLWATTNIGASAAHEFGNYYGWGEVEPKTDYSWANYKYGNSEKDITKYNSEDGLLTLEPADDAATANWGGKWRMPTVTEFIELQYHCYWNRTSDYNSTGVAGYIIYKVKDKRDKGIGGTLPEDTIFSSYSLADTHIFLPAAKNIFGTSIDDENFIYYWTSTRHETTGNPGAMIADEVDKYPMRWFLDLRNIGSPIRGVVSKPETAGIPAGATVGGGRPADGAFYDLTGRKVGAKPAASGVYVRSGKKVVVK